MVNNKVEIREKMLDLISDLPVTYMIEADSKIVKLILDSELFRKANVIFTFITSNLEIDITPIVSAAIKAGKILCAPKCYPDGKMTAHRISGFNDIITGYKKLPEAKDGCSLMNKDEIDLILVPCLAADNKGYRIGYGGGFYDRYLSGYNGNSLLIVRERQLITEIPRETFDIPSAYYVTENGLNASRPSF